MININIGIDIGGRHVGMGIVDDEGKISKKEIINYSSKDDIKIIFDSINEYISKNSKGIKSIGIGVPGIVNKNKIIYTCNLPIENLDIKKYIKTDIPIYLGNDALCATLAEYHYIDGARYSNYALMTIGTGVGAGIIIDGKVYTGKSGIAGEVGHMVIERDGLKCNCGRRGCFERYVSVAKLLKDTGVESLKEFFYLVEKNANVAKVFDKYLNDLAEGIANIINMYDFEVLVLGGSISWFGSKFMNVLKSKVNEKLFNKQTYRLHLKCAKLGNNAGIIGASLLSKYVNY